MAEFPEPPAAETPPPITMPDPPALPPPLPPPLPEPMVMAMPVSEPSMDRLPDAPPPPASEPEISSPPPMEMTPPSMPETLPDLRDSTPFAEAPPLPGGPDDSFRPPEDNFRPPEDERPPLADTSLDNIAPPPLEMERPSVAESPAENVLPPTPEDTGTPPEGTASASPSGEMLSSASAPELFTEDLSTAPAATESLPVAASEMTETPQEYVPSATDAASEVIPEPTGSSLETASPPSDMIPATVPETPDTGNALPDAATDSVPEAATASVPEATTASVPETLSESTAPSPVEMTNVPAETQTEGSTSGVESTSSAPEEAPVETPSVLSASDQAEGSWAAALQKPPVEAIDAIDGDPFLPIQLFERTTDPQPDALAMARETTETEPTLNSEAPSAPDAFVAAPVEEAETPAETNAEAAAIAVPVAPAAAVPEALSEAGVTAEESVAEPSLPASEPFPAAAEALPDSTPVVSENAVSLPEAPVAVGVEESPGLPLMPETVAAAEQGTDTAPAVAEAFPAEAVVQQPDSSVDAPAAEVLLSTPPAAPDILTDPGEGLSEATSLPETPVAAATETVQPAETPVEASVVQTTEPLSAAPEVIPETSEVGEANAVDSTLTTAEPLPAAPEVQPEVVPAMAANAEAPAEAVSPSAVEETPALPSEPGLDIALAANVEALPEEAVVAPIPEEVTNSDADGSAAVLPEPPETRPAEAPEAVTEEPVVPTPEPVTPAPEPAVEPVQEEPTSEAQVSNVEAPPVVAEPTPTEPATTVPSVVENTVEEPTVEPTQTVEPTVEEPRIEEPTVTAPPVVESVAEEPVVEPTTEETLSGEPAVTAPPVVENSVEEPVVEPAVEPTQTEAPTVEEPVVAAPAEETKLEEPVVEPTITTPLVEEPVVEEPQVEEPAAAPPVVEPTVEEPKVEEAVVEPTLEETVVEPIAEEEESVEPTLEEKRELEEEAKEEEAQPEPVPEPTPDPVVPEPAVEEPQEEEPTIEEAKAPVVEEPEVKAPTVEASHVEEAVTEEETAADEPTLAEAASAEPTAETAPSPQPAAVESTLEETVVEEPVADNQSAGSSPSQDPATEESTADTPPLSAPPVESTVAEEPVVAASGEEPKAVEQIVEEPAALPTTEEAAGGEPTVATEPVEETPVVEPTVEQAKPEEAVAETPAAEASGETGVDEQNPQEAAIEDQNASPTETSGETATAERQRLEQETTNRQTEENTRTQQEQLRADAVNERVREADARRLEEYQQRQDATANPEPVPETANTVTERPQQPEVLPVVETETTLTPAMEQVVEQFRQDHLDLNDRFLAQLEALSQRINSPGGLNAEGTPTMAVAEEATGAAQPTAMSSASNDRASGGGSNIVGTDGTVPSVAADGTGGAPTSGAPGTAAPVANAPAISEEPWTPPSEPGAWRSLQQAEARASERIDSSDMQPDSVELSDRADMLAARDRVQAVQALVPNSAEPAASSAEPAPSPSGPDRLAEGGELTDHPIADYLRTGGDEGAPDWEKVKDRFGVAEADNYRTDVMQEIANRFGGQRTGTLGPSSDIDMNFPTEEGRRNAEQEMERLLGPQWDDAMKASFMVDPIRNHPYSDPLLEMTPEQSNSLQQELTRHSETEVLNRMKMAGAESAVAHQMFEEMCTRLDVDPTDVPGRMRTPEELSDLGRVQDRGMEQYNANIGRLEEETRTPGTLSETDKQALQQETFGLSQGIAVRQLQIDSAYPERYLTPGAVKAHVPLDAERHPREATDMTVAEAYQDVLNQHLELAEWMGKSEAELKTENPGQDPTREDVLTRAAEKYELSKYAWRGLSVAERSGMEGAEDLTQVALGLYRPEGGSSMRADAVTTEMAREGIYQDEADNIGPESVPELRKPIFMSLVDRRLTELQDQLIINGARDFAAGEPLPVPEPTATPPDTAPTPTSGPENPAALPMVDPTPTVVPPTGIPANAQPEQEQPAEPRAADPVASGAATPAERPQEAARAGWVEHQRQVQDQQREEQRLRQEQFNRQQDPNAQSQAQPSQQPQSQHKPDENLRQMQAAQLEEQRRSQEDLPAQPVAPPVLEGTVPETLTGDPRPAVIKSPLDIAQMFAQQSAQMVDQVAAKARADLAARVTDIMASPSGGADTPALSSSETSTGLETIISATPPVQAPSESVPAPAVTTPNGPPAREPDAPTELSEGAEQPTSGASNAPEPTPTAIPFLPGLTQTEAKRRMQRILDQTPPLQESTSSSSGEQEAPTPESGTGGSVQPPRTTPLSRPPDWTSLMSGGGGGTGPISGSASPGGWRPVAPTGNTPNSGAQTPQPPDKPELNEDDKR